MDERKVYQMLERAKQVRPLLEAAIKAASAVKAELEDAQEAAFKARLERVECASANGDREQAELLRGAIQSALAATLGALQSKYGEPLYSWLGRYITALTAQEPSLLWEVLDLWPIWVEGWAYKEGKHFILRSDGEVAVVVGWVKKTRSYVTGSYDVRYLTELGVEYDTKFETESYSYSAPETWVLGAEQIELRDDKDDLVKAVVTIEGVGELEFEAPIPGKDIYRELVRAFKSLKSSLDWLVARYENSGHSEPKNPCPNLDRVEKLHVEALKRAAEALEEGLRSVKGDLAHMEEFRAWLKDPESLWWAEPPNEAWVAASIVGALNRALKYVGPGDADVLVETMEAIVKLAS